MNEDQMPYAADDWKEQGYASPEAEIDDMANVGRALMEALPKGYSYNNCPSEIVYDLLNDAADLRTKIKTLEAPRVCSVCAAVIAVYPEGMCCHCQEMPWPVQAPASVDRNGEADETRSEAKGLSPKGESAVPAKQGDAQPTDNSTQSGDQP